MKVLSSLILIICLLTSCFPYAVRQDVVYAPQVYFTPNTDTILLVNNTGYQMARQGHSYIFQDEAGTLVQRTDSFNQEFLLELAKSFKAMGVTAHVESHSLRHDSDYLERKPLDSLMMDSLKRKYKTGFAVVLDAGAVTGDLLVSKLKDTTALYFRYALSYNTDFHVLDLNTHGELAKVSKKTLTNWEAVNISFTKGVQSFAFEDRMRKNEICNMIDQVMKSFFPYGETHERLIFYNKNLNMKDAVRYARKNKWEEASLIWLYMYEHAAKPGHKLYSALNLAYYFERENMLSQTRFWLQKAEDLSKHAYADEQNYMKEYRKDVEKRLSEPEPQVIGYY